MNFAGLAKRAPWWSWIIPLLVLLALGIWLTAAPFLHSHTSLSWQECVYGKPECSTAAATWVLALFGFLAFYAAFWTVYWAKSAFGIEVALALGQSVCTRGTQDAHPADKVVFLTPDGTFVFRQPALVKSLEEEYRPYPNAFENLGRSALSDVTATMYIRDADGKESPPIDVRIGNIKCEQEVHLVVYTPKSAKPVEILWDKDSAKERGEPIAFFPESIRTKAEEAKFNQSEEHEQLALVKLPLEVASEETTSADLKMKSETTPNPGAPPEETPDNR